MDLVQEDQRDLIFNEREEDLKRLSRPIECKCFRTSIWDETLYKVRIKPTGRLGPGSFQFFIMSQHL